MSVNDSKRVGAPTLPRRETALPVPAMPTSSNGNGSSLPEAWAPPAPASEATEGAILQVLRRCWLLAVSVGLIAAAGGAAAAWFLLPAQYTTRALLHIAAQPARGLFSGQETPESSEEFLAHQRTQAAIIRSRDVIQTALRQPQVAARAEVREHPQPVQWLAENLRVDSNLGPEVLSVSLTGDHPEDLPAVVNAVVQAYLEELVNKERAKQPARLEQLEGSYRRLADNLRRKRATLRELESSLGVESPQMLLLRYQTALQQLAAADKEALSTRVALKSAQMELALLKEDKNASLASQLTVEQHLTQDAAYQALLARKVQLEEEVSKIRALTAPGMRETLTSGSQSQLASINRDLEGRRRAVRPAIVAQDRSKLEVRVAVLQDQQKEIAAELKRQQAEVNRLALALSQPDRPTSDLETLRDEIAQTEQALKKVGEQRDILKIELPLPARVSLLEAADVPQTADLKQKGKMAGLCGGSLFALAALGVCLREYRSRRVRAEDDVTVGLGLNVLGALPALPREKATGTVVEQTLLRLAVDTLRDNIWVAGNRESPQRVTITSARADEGKTALAVELARSLASAGNKVLLLDSNFAQPRVHRYFDLPAEPGFSEVLQGGQSLETAVRPTNLPGLSVLPAGKENSAAALALAEGQSKLVMKLLEEYYDFVIVEAAPVLSGVEALLLAKLSDGVILSVMRDVSQIADLQDAHQFLTSMGAPVLGTVLSGVDSKLRR